MGPVPVSATAGPWVVPEADVGLNLAPEAPKKPNK